ncbi:MAG: hypothetical protein KDN20_08135 [Verrucomicrobiae bacterium]|nr:hypothetical protein [Verrucomicrobiae bacterium]
MAHALALPSNIASPKPHFWLAMMGCLIISGFSQGQDEANQAPVFTENGLPSPIAADAFSMLMENSPFTRSLNLSDRLILTGIASMDGKKVATLMNRETKETYVVSEEPNPQGWKMVEVDGNDDLEKVAAKISIAGGEVVTVRYDEWSLKPGEAKPASGGGGEIREGERRSRDHGGRGPSPEMREKMMALSEDQRRKVFEYMMKKRSEIPDMSEEDRGKLFQKALERAGKSK